LSEEEKDTVNNQAEPEEEEETYDPNKINYRDSFDVVYYEYGQAFYGSFRGMRYRIARNPLENVFFTPKDKRGEAFFEGIIWPEPKSFANTADDKKTTKLFSFDKEGKKALIEWLNEQYLERKEEWDEAKANFNE